MKIVQSFWTKPIIDQSDSYTRDRFNGGWPSSTYHFMSWALSCLKLRQHYESVELVTDRMGKYLLIDLLNLPYTRCEIVLDQLSHYPSDLWALGKILTYSLQKEPFLHVDSDVYIWKKFRPALISASLVAQNQDCNHPAYQRMLSQMEALQFKMPAAMVRERKAQPDIFAVNAGILGGQSIEFMKEYTELAFSLVDNNLELLSQVETAAFNPVMEQYLFYCLAQEKQLPIQYFFSEVDYGNAPFDYVRFWDINYNDSGYIHLISGFKKDMAMVESMAFRLRAEYPAFYYQILSLAAGGYI